MRVRGKREWRDVHAWSEGACDSMMVRMVQKARATVPESHQTGIVDVDDGGSDGLRLTRVELRATVIRTRACRMEHRSRYGGM